MNTQRPRLKIVDEPTRPRGWSIATGIILLAFVAAFAIGFGHILAEDHLQQTPITAEPRWSQVAHCTGDDENWRASTIT